MSNPGVPQGADGKRVSTAAMARLALAATLLLVVAGCPQSQPPDAPKEDQSLDSDIAKASYGLGYNIAGNVSAQYGEALDADAFSAGLSDGLKGAEARVSEQEVLAGINALNAEREASRQSASVANLERSRAFLAENGRREGVTTLPSGLQYEVLVAADGARPTVNDRVKTHYQGTLPDGSVFDSSVERGEPAVFPVNGVIRGWVEALQLMSVGSKWKLYVPPELAYGERGAGGRIGPNQALVFEVELLEILPPE